MTTFNESETLKGKISLAGMLSELGETISNWNDPIASAARGFKKDLPDFYASFADRLESATGLNISDMFERDAQRYSHDEEGKQVKTPRGVLSEYWAKRYLDVGGNLALTFAGTIPKEDVTLIAMGQEAGVGALPSTLRDLARISLLIRKAKSLFFGATIMGFLAVSIVVAALIATQLFTVPKLRESFYMPPEFLPNSAKNLYAFGDFIGSYFIFIFLFIGIALYLVIWSLPNLTGDFRKKLDKSFIWRLYRDLQGALFLAVLSTMVRRRGNTSDNLVNSLARMAQDTTPWRQWHIEKMLHNIQNLDVVGSDNSSAIANAMNTGMIDAESFYYFLDVQEGQGISVGLQKAGERVEGPTLATVGTQARWISTIMLFIALVSMMGWAGWHIITAKALIDGMRNYLSS